MSKPAFYVSSREEWLTRRRLQGTQHVLGRACFVPALPEFKFWLFLDEDNDMYTIVEDKTGMALASYPVRSALHQEVRFQLSRRPIEASKLIIQEAIAKYSPVKSTP